MKVTPTYFVSGYMRCGTSMMMQALSAGGLEAAFDPARDKMNDQFGDEHYKPNEGGFYELTGKEYQKLDFPKGYEGKLIKMLFGGMYQLSAGGPYKIVFMLRDFEESRQSYEGFFGQKLPIQKRDVFEAQRAKILGILHQRQDCEVFEIEYRKLVEDPEKWFRMLRDIGRFPIDPQAAAAVVDPAKCRFRLEELEVGI